MPRTLGIDIGTAITGWAIVDEDKSKTNGLSVIEYGAITTKSSLDMPSRLEIIYDEFGAIVDEYKPRHVAVESLFFFKNQKTVMTVSQSRGVVLMASRQKGLDIFEYTPLQVKTAVTGYGRADKKQVQKMVRVILGLKEIPKPDDAADAIAICVAHRGSIKQVNMGVK